MIMTINYLENRGNNSSTRNFINLQNMSFRFEIGYAGLEDSDCHEMSQLRLTNRNYQSIHQIPRVDIFTFVNEEDVCNEF